MTNDEFESLAQTSFPLVLIDVGELEDRSDRTLLWGYTAERYSWHVFLRAGEIEIVVYEFPYTIMDHKRDHTFDAADLIPNKRLYPEACDYEFCTLLCSVGVFLPFTTFDGKREHKQYHGLVPKDYP